MKRFWVFPLVLGLVGAIFPVFSYVEGIARGIIDVLITMGTLSPFRYGLLQLWNVTWPYGLGVGFILGIGLAVGDWFRPKNLVQNSNADLRLIPNLFWCGLYVLLVNAINTAIFYALVSRNPHIETIYALGLARFAMPGILNLAAILWAALRSIRTDDVLTPRVLLPKLRRQTRGLDS